MKINNIKSKDYYIIENGNILKIIFENTTLEELQMLDKTLVVTTDSGETVETLTNWQAVKINYDIAKAVYEVEFRMVFKDEVVKDLESKLLEANKEIDTLKKDNKTLESAVLEIAELVGNTEGGGENESIG